MAILRSTGLKDAVQKAGGVSLADAMANGVLYIYSGTKPANADTTEGTAVALHVFTVKGMEFTPGVAANGLNFSLSTDGYLYKAVEEEWLSVAPNFGASPLPATWARFYNNARILGDSTTAIRFDLTVGTSASFDINLRSTLIYSGDELKFNSFRITGP